MNIPLLKDSKPSMTKVGMDSNGLLVDKVIGCRHAKFYRPYLKSGIDSQKIWNSGSAPALVRAVTTPP